MTLDDVMMIHPAGGRHLVATVSFLALELRGNRKEWDLATVPLAEFQEAGGTICFYPVMCECCWFVWSPDIVSSGV